MFRLDQKLEKTDERIDVFVKLPRTFELNQIRGKIGVQVRTDMPGSTVVFLTYLFGREERVVEAIEMQLASTVTHTSPHPASPPTNFIRKRTGSAERFEGGSLPAPPGIHHPATAARQVRLCRYAGTGCRPSCIMMKYGLLIRFLFCEDWSIALERFLLLQLIGSLLSDGEIAVGRVPCLH
jgi:hypothetical protein